MTSISHIERNTMNTLTTLPAVTISDTRFGKLRSVVLDGQTWFVAKDICRALGIQNTALATKGVSPSQKRQVKTDPRQGRPSIVLTEAGMYALILRSKKPAAQRFRKIIVQETFPSLMNHVVFEKEIAPTAFSALFVQASRNFFAANEGTV
ncbi:hypothetical protein CDV50_02030 [Haematobacter massiliensis]|uniref:Uncharacterized protein n=2 Tax=Haematobacter massiliensis TaxID=195105 RepID=A0A086YBA0_9RHOB|nr:hypothetical protein CN97_10000 [Haematobacter massiliensis]OWJ73657.1 hypothetical protein CDV50_02030 [Haematobacter massiliensis]OWJ81868.1 hypothetical protein CDV51_18745 [Haematobacter massiliensis]QBJ23417.1 hypothetical protein HmaOT1_03550 [Haematobacter massiliensis]